MPPGYTEVFRNLKITVVPHDQLKSLILRLVGDKDHEKVFDITAKVEKRYRRNSRGGGGGGGVYA